MIIQSLVSTIEQFCQKYGKGREQLLPVLQELDACYNYFDENIINEVARAFDISQTEVYSVASFYHLFNTKPKGKFVIRLCRTIACDLAGKNRIINALEAELGICMGETSADKLYTLDFANCMGMCDKGPAMMVNDDLYAELTPSRAVDIVKSYK